MDPAGDPTDKRRSDGEHPPDHAERPPPSPPSSTAPAPAPAPAQKSVTWNSDLTREAPPAAASAAAIPSDPSPDITPPPAPPATNTIGTIRDMLGRWGKKASEVTMNAAEATKRASDLAGDVLQHLKTGPSFAEAALGRIAQGTKVIAEGGYEKIFRQTFEALPEERLKRSYACYLSTSAGPVMGVLYLSTAKVAFCSDNPLSYKAGNQTEWSYYKVVIPLDQLRAANPSASNTNPAEKYIQIVSIDNQEFWFMGFVNYNGAVYGLQDALHESQNLQP